MQFSWWTFALQTINFVVLIWLLHRFLYRPVLRMIDARRQAIDRRQEEIAGIEAETKAKLTQIDQERGKIAAEREAMLAAASEQAARIAEADRRKSEQAAALLLEGSRKTLTGEREAALAEARRLAVDLGVEVARRLLAQIPMQQRAEAWIERIERHLAALPPADRAGLFNGAGQGGAVQVITAVPLSEEIQADWITRLRRALAQAVGDIQFSVDPELVAGADLHFPTAILRFSWRSELLAIRAEIERDANGH